MQATGTQEATASPWRSGIFRSIWIANLASNFGGLIQTVGAAWMMTALGASSQLIALVQTATALPLVLLSLPAGALADSHDRRVIMLVAQIFMLAVSLALAICAALGVLTPWLLLGFTFLIGCGTSLKNPAWQASVGDMVPRPALPAAVAMNSMGFNIARSLGPAIGGVIVAATGAATAFAVNALSYIGLIAVLAGWKQSPSPRLLPPERLAVAIEAGLRYVAMSPNLKIVLIRATAFGVGASAAPALMPLIARDIVDGGALVYGLLLGAFGVGAVAGAFGRNRLRAFLSNEVIVQASGVALAVGVGVSAISPSVVVTLPALGLAGAGWVLALSTFNVSVQLSSPRWVVARTLSIYQMAVFGGMAGGSALFGWLADSHGAAAGLMIAGGLQLAAAGLGFLLPLPNAEALDLDPLDRFKEPETSVPIEPRSGPIVVTVEYRIAEDRTVAFLTAMSERRRIRRRDGAHGWRLMRDLGEPNLWVERYHVATWLDYVRHNTRRTRADMANIDLLHQLQDEREPIRVHRMIERQPSVLPWARAAEAREFSVNDPTGHV
ncbi:Enterobactin exporter EntS [Brevundimonas sp. NIBR11]|nr:Enterobactin exporter EntS [Brevundimonas sp. NIBR11]